MVRGVRRRAKCELDLLLVLTKKELDTRRNQLKAERTNSWACGSPFKLRSMLGYILHRMVILYYLMLIYI